MYSIVLDTLKQHETVWDQIPEFVSAVNALETKLQEFTTTAEDRLIDTTKITQRKLDMIDLLHEKVYGVVKLIESYAIKQNLPQLALEYSIPKGSLVEGGAKASITRFTNVVKKATELSTDLEAYGLTPQLLQEITQEVEDTRKKIMEPRLAILQRKMLNKRLEQLIDQLDEIVYTHISGMMRLLQFDHADFYESFVNARMIIDVRGSGSRSEDESPPGINSV